MGSKRQPSTIAVVAVHGVGSPKAGDVARMTADNLARAAGGLVFEEHALRLHASSGLDACTPLLIGALNPTLRAHVFELYWADLSKNKPTVISILSQLLQLAPRLLLIGRQGLRDARESKAVGALSVSRLYDAVTLIMRWGIPLLNVFVILVAAAAIIFVLPSQTQYTAAVGILGLLSLVAATYAVYKWGRDLSPWSALSVSLALAVMLFSGARASATATWDSHWQSLLLFGEVLFVGASLFGAALYYLTRPRRPFRYAMFMLPLIFVATWAIWLATKYSVSGAKFDYSVLGEVTRPLLSLLASLWLLVLFLTGALWLMSCRVKRSDARATRAVRTARWSLAVSFAVAVLAQTFLLTVLREFVPFKEFFPSVELAHFVFDALKLAWPLVTFTVLMALLALGIWSLAPSVFAEAQGPPSPDLESTKAKSARLGLWLTSGQVTLATAFAACSLPLIFGGPAISLASYFYSPLQDLLAGTDHAFWSVMLPASLAVLAGVLRSPSGLKRIWPVLGIVLDVDTYLREDDVGSQHVRTRILDRGMLLLQALESGKAKPGTRYSQIVIVGHSQGTLIAADLLRLRANGSEARSVPISLVTMGSPIRALYAALLPYKMAWFLDAADTGSEYGLGTVQWQNLYFAGDYVGRSLWREDDAKATYTEPYKNEQIGVSEACLGPGAHMQYWKSPVVGRELLAQMEA